MANTADTYEAPATLNADFGQRVVIDTNALPWLPSPQAGVERRLLDRVGAEVARATSLVRYAPDSRFPSHTHGAGEEFLVLEGTFCDEHGAYSAGTYVRNPPGSSHAPFTHEGCTILVKLRQMQPQHEPHVVVNTNEMSWGSPLAGGARNKPLYEASPGGEWVALVQLPTGSELITPPEAGGEELLVLDGVLAVDEERHAAGSWTRTPHGSGQRWLALEDSVCWVKRGHLRTRVET